MWHVQIRYYTGVVVNLIKNIGEPAFIEKMHLRYHDLATQAGITICHAAVHFYIGCVDLLCDTYTFDRPLILYHVIWA